MRLFTPAWDWSDDFPIDSDFRWSLPLADCPECGSSEGWFMGLHYPQLDLVEVGLDSQELRELRETDEIQKVSWEEFLVLRERIAAHLPEGALLWPNTKIGPTFGKSRLRVPDMTSSFACNMYLSVAAIEALTQAEIKIEGVFVDFKTSQRRMIKMMDVCAPAVASVGGSSRSDCCGTCWRGLPSEYSIDSKSVDPERHVFRAREKPFRLLLSERFVACLTGGEFDLPNLNPVELS
jgi:hypothetical protein